MTSISQDKFLGYYHRELSYLRNAGQIFAAQHPKIARRLQLSDSESPDPHTERLLESFAFLSARLSQEIDDRVPQIASALLEVLYPHLINPVPSMAIAQFVVDPSKGKLTSGFDVSAKTRVQSFSEEGVACRFQTAYPVTLWPITVEAAEFIQPLDYQFETPQLHKSYLRLKLSCQGLDFSDLDLQTLRFFINADDALSLVLYEIIFAQTAIQVLKVVKDRQAYCLPKGSIQPVGFNANECILPSPEHSHPAYQILHEYFHFPKKYLFFDINNLNFKQAEQTVEILIGLDSHHPLENISISADNFRLGCTPIVNLFPKITDPLRLDHRKFEYRLVADQRRERTTEIYSIEKVLAGVDGSTETLVYHPYYSFDHQAQQTDPSIFWTARRTPSERRDVPGSDIYLRFVDLDFNPHTPPTETIYAQALCTNRFLAEQIPAGCLLQLEDKAPISKIICLTKPTSQVYTPNDGETMWRLISMLSVNHLSVSAGSTSLKALKESLLLYAKTAGNFHHNEIDSLVNIETHPTSRRLGEQAWRGFVNGLKITLTVNERAYTGESVFLLASVLRTFFALQTSLNSFVQLQVNSVQRQGEWMSWQPLHGAQIVL
ncbi:type VI secretion system baseplate subunit TssF [Candidatus Odyssella thessalonicensis]|uniref:type VI secretion system baseplate subunit TssF n=1 Tax=Candidatus Odyssella thessalonicensis TaxID=84647 RepID=UPI000225C0B3|nr:type VI secretion system baseplate subunit TssF [Candidatus Odyssella thessalonicensis]